MIELNELAFQNADVLMALDAAPNGQFTKKGLAEHLGRDDSNLGKSLRRLAEAGILDPDNPMAGLTEAGQIQLSAILRARDPDGAIGARTRWPIDRIRRNPANRIPQSLAVIALSDTIEAAGDVLQNVQLTPPDATGVRMLLAGEHRWEAVQRLATLDRLPPALVPGIPFTERDADPAEQILIRIVENSARTDLSPLDDARQLLALQQATGWSAREVAKKTGRSPADSDTGVRDVQVKIKVAREATEEAIVEYERTGSWDALRDSVADRRPASIPTDPTPLEQAIDHVWTPDELSAARTPGEEPAFEAEALLRQDTLTSPMTAWAHGAEPMITLTSWRRADGQIGYSWSVTLSDGARDDRDPLEFYADADTARRRTITRLRALWRDRLSVEALMWLDAQVGPFVVNGTDYFNASRATEARIALGWEQRKSNSARASALKTALQELAQAERAGTPDPAPDAEPESGADLLARARALAHDDGQPWTGDTARGLLAELGYRPRAGVHGVCLELDRTDGPPQQVLHVTGPRYTPQAEALNWLVGWAIEKAFAEESPTAPGQSPAVPIDLSVDADFIICLEDGRKFKSLKRHLRTRYNLSPEEYRAKWGLPEDYPMVAANYEAARRDLAARMGAESAGTDIDDEVAS